MRLGSGQESMTELYAERFIFKSEEVLHLRWNEHYLKAYSETLMIPLQS